MTKFHLKFFLTLILSISFASQSFAQEILGIHVDPNGSCMKWYFESVSTDKKYTCDGEFEKNESVYSRGRCKDTPLKVDKYRFWYGGQQSVKVEVRGAVDIRINTDNQKGLFVSSDPNKIEFGLQTLKFNQKGFPGRFAVEGETKNLRQRSGANGCEMSSQVKSELRIMQDARFLVTGEWSTSPIGHVHGGSHFIFDDDVLTRVWQGNPAFLIDEATSTVYPNPDYWLTIPL